MIKKRYLLVEPEFPIPAKSKNHHNFLPIGLLKLAAYYRVRGNDIKLVRGNLEKYELKYKPHEILVTSLFTYWSKYVKETVQHYRYLFPKAKIVVGGIYSSLMPDHCKRYTGCDEVFIGVHPQAEKHFPAYDLVNVDYQIIHSSRGCIRKCEFCGTWRIEPRFIPKKSIKDEIRTNKLIFYDNNFLANPYVTSILQELTDVKYKGKPVFCESQSGFDGRILLQKPYLAQMLKNANFKNPRIAWDHQYSDWRLIKKQIDLLIDSGYKPKEVYVFMIYNGLIPFKEMEKKRKKCWSWGVQISDCRFRPLNQTFDEYNPRKKQTNKDYYIHSLWTDEQIKQFRKNIRRQNICIRHEVPFYSKLIEQKRLGRRKIKQIKTLSKKNISRLLGNEIWFP